MARIFNAGGRIVVPSDASFQGMTAFTYAVWGRPSDLGIDQGIFQTDEFGGGNGYRSGEIDINDRLYAGIHRATSDCQARADLSNFAGWPGWDEWTFFCGMVDTAGAASAQRLFVGSLWSAPTGPSSYVNQSAGAGSLSSDATDDLSIGNRKAGSQDRPFGGPMADFRLWRRLLSIPEVYRVWADMRARLRGMVVWHRYNRAGGLQPDRANRWGNHAQANASTVFVPHVPLRTRIRHPIASAPVVTLTANPPVSDLENLDGWTGEGGETTDLWSHVDDLDTPSTYAQSPA